MVDIKLLKIGATLPVNEELAGLVPMASEAEQSALTEDIKANGLKEPVVLWHGEIIDGRCRQIACTVAGKPLMARELDDTLTEEEVRIFVKSVNTRRNLTHTQKVMSACRESLRPNSNSVISIAKAWGISKALLDNARYIAKEHPEFVQPLFNGKTVNIINANGDTTVSNKISAIYAYIKRTEEKVKEDTQHGWSEDSYIKTQAGKDWYYSQVQQAETLGEAKYKMLVAELANYKFHTSS